MSSLKHIRIIAPSCSNTPASLAKKQRTIALLEEKGYRVTYGKHLTRQHRFETASVNDRLADLHAAYTDKSVDAIVCLSGGWSVNALLPKIDWGLIKANPKPLVGYSDITVLVNAIYAQTGQPNGLLGPTLGVLSERLDFDYTFTYLERVLVKDFPVQLRKSQRWSSRDRSRFMTRWRIIQKGEAKGVAIGGNLGTFYLLQGTSYMPHFNQPTILVVEDDDEAGKYTAREFDRRLTSLLQQPGARENIQGMLIGRFLTSSRVSFTDIRDIIKRANLPNIPIVANMDFGHTIPMFTIPIGSTIRLRVKNHINCEILEA